MEHRLATAEKKVLVKLVKEVQKLGLRGEHGGWKEFLDVNDKKFGSSLSDPWRRSNDVLVAFLMTFKKEEHLKILARVLQYDEIQDLMEKFGQESPDRLPPEQRLVYRTLQHPEYLLLYTFPSYAEGWFKTELGKKPEVMKPAKMLAVDCEMVLCEDGTEAVVSVAVVDSELNVKLNELVNPKKPVADYRTNITGVNAADIEKVTFSVADVQNRMQMQGLLSSDTILVGHSLNNDLQVLKIDHARVIDTSLIFEYYGAHKHRKPSLNNLCKSILGREVRKEGDAHDRVEDAKFAMRLVLAVIKKGVEITRVLATENMPEAERRLFLHKIPHNVPSQELVGVISGDFQLEIKQSKKQGDYYCAVALFNTPEEANQAFENLEGSAAMDSFGLPQKLVHFRLSSGSGAALYVRKMVQDDSLGQISAKKRAFPDEDNNNFKKLKVDNETEETVAADIDQGNGDTKKALQRSRIKQKTEEESIVNGNHCEDHLKEIEDLKRKLKEKDFRLEIYEKIISELKRERSCKSGNHCEDHLKEIEVLKQKLKENFQLEVHEKIIAKLKRKRDNKIGKKGVR